MQVSTSALPDISVIVVCFNQEHTIERTLRSIISQNFGGKVEIVVSDDKSSDNTVAVAERVAAEYPDIVRLVAHNENQGVQKNYFGALRQCRGKYIADCAGDDFWIDPNKLQMEFDLMEKHPEVTLVHTAWNKYYPDGSTEAVLPAGMNARSIYDASQMAEKMVLAQDGVIVHLCTALYRRDAAMAALTENEDSFLNPEYGCEDLPLIVELARNGKFAYLPEITLNYSVGAPSISSQENPAKNFDFQFGVLKLRILLGKQMNLPADKLMKMASAKVRYLISQAFRVQSADRMDTIRQFAAESNIPIDMKGRIYIALSSNQRLWSVARKALKN